MSFNLADLFEQVAKAIPTRTAVVCGSSRLTYAELNERANCLAQSLARRGIGKNDHVGLQMHNGPEYLESMLAAFKLRAVPININYHYVENELEYIYNDADLVALIVNQSYAPAAIKAAASSVKLKHLYCVLDNSQIPVDKAFVNYEEAVASTPPLTDFPDRASDDLYIVYTGGTTGMPKGVMWRHEDIFFAAMGGGDPLQTMGPIKEPSELAGRILNLDMGTALPTPPFMHAAAQWLAFNFLLSGGQLVIPPGGGFDPEIIWDSVQSEGVRTLIIVGDAMATPLESMLSSQRKRWNVSSLQVIASGGALFSPSVKEKLLDALPGCMILDGLGSSETGALGNKVSSGEGAVETEPRFLVSDRICVLDDNNKPIKPGTDSIGRLARRGHVPIGYYNAPEKSAATFVQIDGERWAIPGDLASVLADGSILLHGRGSTCINTGGEKVFPEEVEAILKGHPGISDAVVVGLPDPRFGQKVVAVCESQNKSALEEQSVREFCRLHLARYKLPRNVVTVDRVKRSPAGKADYPWAKTIAEKMLAETS